MIRTERLSVRKLRFEDWKALQAIWTEINQTEYARYDRPNMTEDSAVRERLEKWVSFADDRDHLFYVVCLDAVLIGYVVLHRSEDAYEIGYCFHPDYHGHGYARESILGILEHLRSHGAKLVKAGSALNNTPSVKLLRSLGFRQTGTEKVSFYRDAEGNDIVFEGGLFELPL